MVASARDRRTTAVVQSACRSPARPKLDRVARHTPDTVAVPVTCAHDVTPPSLSPPDRDRAGALPGLLDARRGIGQGVARGVIYAP